MEWSAHAPDGDDDLVEPARVVEGTVIRMMPEYSLTVPLWDLGGPLEERDLLEGVLRLSPSLIDDLARWQSEWDDVNSAAVSDDAVPPKPLPKGWGQDHRRRGRELFARLQREIDPRFEMRMHS